MCCGILKEEGVSIVRAIDEMKNTVTVVFDLRPIAEEGG